jgi:hypothetical protein
MYPTSQRNDDIPAEVLDGITQVLANASGPADRATIIHNLVLEIHETVQWLHEPETADDELLSVSPLLTEALRHQRRMASAAHDREGHASQHRNPSVPLAS